MDKINFVDIYQEGNFDIIDFDNIKDSFFFNQKNVWDEKYEMLCKYIEENEKLPVESNKELGKWVSQQKRNYKNLKENK